MFLQIPEYSILDFNFAAWAAHVVDSSPAYQTRSDLRFGLKALDAIDGAKYGWVELPDDVAERFKAACDVAPLPVRFLIARDKDGKQLGEPEPVAHRAYDPFYEAVEQMVKERPAPVDAPALATAAE